MKRQKILIYIITIVILFTGCFVFIRIHNGVRIKPAADHVSKGPVISYRQDEEAWAQDHLGDSSYTMKSSGCLVTCIASAVSSGGEEAAPGALNKLFSENGVYDGEGNLQWGRLFNLSGYHVTVYEDVTEEDIAQCLSAGLYPIVRVRMYGIGNFHYVLIVGTDRGEYVCMDPLQDELTKLSDYWGRVYAVRCVWKR